MSDTASAADVPEGMRRRLGVTDAVVVGLGAMIGVGIFAALAPAAQVAGSGLLVGLMLAAVVAYCNATSSARLAVRYPASGGTYVYGRERLGPSEVTWRAGRSWWAGPRPVPRWRSRSGSTSGRSNRTWSRWLRWWR